MMKKQFAFGGRIGLALGLAIAGLIAVMGLGGGGPARAGATAVSPVSMVDSAFNPPVVTITAGSSVRWTNNGSLLHTSTSDTGLWDSGALSAGGMFTRTFNTPGVYGYHCIFHGAPGIGMAGSVVVVSSTFLPVVMKLFGP